MHGLLFRRTNTTNTKPLGVQPLKEGGNVVMSADGKYFTYLKDIDEIYAGNPYYKKDVIEQAEPYEELLKTVPEDRQIGNADGYEPAGNGSVGSPLAGHVQRKVTLDEIYKDNPYYKPATT